MALPNTFVEYSDFLNIQETYDGKIEYYNGQVIYMSPTSIQHNRIITNIVFE